VESGRLRAEEREERAGGSGLRNGRKEWDYSGALIFRGTPINQHHFLPLGTVGRSGFRGTREEREVND
jgi:hypothetical protein